MKRAHDGTVGEAGRRRGEVGFRWAAAALMSVLSLGCDPQSTTVQLIVQTLNRHNGSVTALRWSVLSCVLGSSFPNSQSLSHTLSIYLL